MPQIKKGRIDPLDLANSLQIATDAIIDFGEGVKGGEDPFRAGIGVAGASIGNALAYRMGKSMMKGSSNEMVQTVVPVANSFAGSIAGGWAGDRIDDLIRGVPQDELIHNSRAINNFRTAAINTSGHYIYPESVSLRNWNHYPGNSNIYYY